MAQRRVTGERVALRSFPPARHVLLLCAHAPHQDPRISWVADHAPAGVTVHVVGVDSGRALERTRKTGAAELVASRELSRYADMAAVLEPLHAGGTGWRTLSRIGDLARANPARLLRGALHHFLDTNLGLIAEASRFGSVHAIICADLDTLPAGVVLKRAFGVPLLYDAHEFWPDSSSLFATADIEFWKSIEAELIREVDSAFIVSTQLAQFVSALYGKEFASVPNCEPLRPLPDADPACRPAGLMLGACVFLFQGRFAPDRGLNRLIDAWPDTDPRAILVLRGPKPGADFPIHEYVAGSGLAGRRIFLMPSVAETRLVAAARAADVGLVPYEPSTINNRYSCPNKLSQYMAARVPILHNRLDYVQQVVAAAGCGRGADFADRAELIRAVNALAADASLREALGDAGRRYHENHFHWEAVSAPLYRELTRLVSAQRGAECRLHTRMEFPKADVGIRLRLSSLNAAQAVWKRVPQPMRQVLRPFANALRRLFEPRPKL